MVGVDKAELDVENLTSNAIKFLNEFDNNEFLKALARYLVTREK